MSDLFGLDSDLLSQLTRGRDDNGPDIVWLGALVAASLLAELGVVLDDSLDDGNEETQSFASTGLCLCDTAIN